MSKGILINTFDIFAQNSNSVTTFHLFSSALLPSTEDFRSLHALVLLKRRQCESSEQQIHLTMFLFVCT